MARIEMAQNLRVEDIAKDSGCRVLKWI
jgi:hypothetical protein